MRSHKTSLMRRRAPSDTDIEAAAPKRPADDAEAGSSLSWVPGNLNQGLPPYLALIAALEEDVRSGALPHGTQLPPHRALALQLGLSLSTVSKAYREANARGIVTGRVGQGTFVARRAASDMENRAGRTSNFSVNLAPDVGQKEKLRLAMAEVMRSGDIDRLFAYDAGQGLREHCAVLAEWISTPGFRPSPDLLLATNGAQHGLDLALSILCKPNDTILVEQLTYVGFKALASLHRYNLAPVEMDAEGMVPEALDLKLQQTGARVVYAMPTLHTPTSRTMSARRRQGIADVLVKHDAMLIEDDVYAFLVDPKPDPIAGLIPDRTVYLASLSKVFELGFRAGMAVVPSALLERARLAMRASAWSATPLLFELSRKLIQSGELKDIVISLRKETRRRVDLFRNFFPEQTLPHDGALAGYHVWMDIPEGWPADELFFVARNQGILLTPPGSAAVDQKGERGVRVCLGACVARELDSGLDALRQILARPPRSAFSVA